MHLELAYGKGSLGLDLPAGATVVEPAYVQGLPDQVGAVKAALAAPIGERPLAELARPGMRVGHRLQRQHARRLTR